MSKLLKKATKMADFQGNSQMIFLPFYPALKFQLDFRLLKHRVLPDSTSFSTFEAHNLTSHECFLEKWR